MLKFGKQAPRPGAIQFKFEKYFDQAVIPTPPTKFGHYSQIHRWGMLGNDEVGDCVLAGAAHETMMWNFQTRAGHLVPMDDESVLSDYSSITGYDPDDPNSDQGTSVVEAAKYRRVTGVLDAEGNRHKIDAYLDIPTKDPNVLAKAAYLFGAVGIGLEITQNAMDQFDDGLPWYVDVNHLGPVLGLHYVPVVGRNKVGDFLVVTWGRLHAMSSAFFAAYNDEVVGYVSLEMLNARGLSLEGFNQAALEQDLRSLA